MVSATRCGAVSGPLKAQWPTWESPISRCSGETGQLFSNERDRTSTVCTFHILMSRRLTTRLISYWETAHQATWRVHRKTSHLALSSYSRSSIIYMISCYGLLSLLFCSVLLDWETELNFWAWSRRRLEEPNLILKVFISSCSFKSSRDGVCMNLLMCVFN